MTDKKELSRHSLAVGAIGTQTSVHAHDATALIERLLAYLGLRNDACLARELGIPPFTISKLRKGSAAVDTDMLIRMHEASGLAISELRALMGPRN